jgi:CrcB protein
LTERRAPPTIAPLAMGFDRLAWVCLGSALGGGARFLIAQAAFVALGPGFPFGTLFVNLVGSFLIGAILRFSLTSGSLSPELRLFLTTGVMGGLTTYSAFNYETLQLATSGDGRLAVLYFAATTLGCLAAGLAGLWLGRVLAG